MTTNKPEVVAYLYAGTSMGDVFERYPFNHTWRTPYGGDHEYIQGVPLIRLSDYASLQAERDTLVEALEGIMRVEARDRVIPVGAEWDTARAARRNGGDA